MLVKPMSEKRLCEMQEIQDQLYFIAHSLKAAAVDNIGSRLSQAHLHCSQFLNFMDRVVSTFENILLIIYNFFFVFCYVAFRTL